MWVPKSKKEDLKCYHWKVKMKYRVQYLVIYWCVFNLPDCTHFSEFKDCFISVLDGLAEERSEFLVVEDLEGAARGDFADCCRVKSMVVVAVAGLHEDGAVRHTVGINFAVQVSQLNTWNQIMWLSQMDKKLFFLPTEHSIHKMSSP